MENYSSMVVGNVGNIRDAMTVGSVGNIRDVVAVGSVGNIRDAVAVGSIGNIRDAVVVGSVGNIRDAMTIGSVGNIRDVVAVGSVGNIGDAMTVGSVGNIRDAVAVGSVGNIRDAVTVGDTVTIGSVGNIRDAMTVGSVGNIRDAMTVGSVGNIRDVVAVGSVGNIRDAMTVGDTVTIGSVGNIRDAMTVGNIEECKSLENFQQGYFNYLIQFPNIFSNLYHNYIFNFYNISINSNIPHIPNTSNSHGISNIPNNSNSHGIPKNLALDKNPFQQKMIDHQKENDTIFEKNLQVGEHNAIWSVVFGSQATREVKLHAVYCVLFLGLSYRIVGLLFGKGKSTIGNWVKKYKEEGDCERQKLLVGSTQKVFQEQEDWLISYVFNIDPLVFLHELKSEFEKRWGYTISISTISRILEKRGISKRVIERRALEIRFEDVLRYEYEFNLLYPLFDQLLFLDEMSTDNRSMLRKRGWFLKNSYPYFRGIFRRGTRISILAFLSVNGLIEVYQTDGTFDRFEFFSCIRQLLQSGKVQPYPGKCSVWILDGASIHLDCNMIDYLWLCGIHVLFLPAYCPFFNPIEILFGLVKRKCQSLFHDSYKMNDELILATSLSSFAYYNFSNIFEACGYCINGRFNRLVSYDHFVHLRGDLEEDKNE